MIEAYSFIAGFLVGIISIMVLLNLTWIKLIENIRKNFKGDKK